MVVAVDSLQLQLCRLRVSVEIGNPMKVEGEASLEGRIFCVPLLAMHDFTDRSLLTVIWHSLYGRAIWHC